MIMFNLYKRIDLFCKDMNISITKMCVEAGITRSVMSELKSGRSQTLSSETIKKISNYFDISTKFLMNVSPFDNWEKINADRDGFLYYIPVPNGDLKFFWHIDKKAPYDSSVKDFIKFLDQCIESASVSEDGDWEIKIVPSYEKAWHSLIINGFDDEAELYKLKYPELTNETVTYPVIGEIAAGYDHIALEDWSGDTVEIPKQYLKGRKRDEFFVLSVKGNSMYPLYLNGDKVLILRQSAPNNDGDVCAIIYDGECGTLKKIFQNSSNAELVPINPEFMSKKIAGSDLEKLIILGIPKLIIREIN